MSLFADRLTLYLDPLIRRREEIFNCVVPAQLEHDAETGPKSSNNVVAGRIAGVKDRLRAHGELNETRELHAVKCFHDFLLSERTVARPGIGKGEARHVIHLVADQTTITHSRLRVVLETQRACL